MADSSPKRARKVADSIRQNIALLIKKEVNDPRLADVSITSVDLSSDLRNAKIYFILSDVSGLADAEKAFSKANGFLRSLLAETMDMRYVPKITFVYDKSIDHGSKMSELIEKARNLDDEIKRRNDD